MLCVVQNRAWRICGLGGGVGNCFISHWFQAVTYCHRLTLTDCINFSRCQFVTGSWLHKIDGLVKHCSDGSFLVAALNWLQNVTSWLSKRAENFGLRAGVTPLFLCNDGLSSENP